MFYLLTYYSFPAGGAGPTHVIDGWLFAPLPSADCFMSSDESTLSLSLFLWCTGVASVRSMLQLQ